MSKAFAKHSPLLVKPSRASALDFALGAALGIAVFLLIYGPSTLNVTYDSWIYNGYIEQDIIQRYAGWLYYRAAPWAWPLTVAENLSVPYGASILFTDSIPFAAILAKLLSPLMPQTFQFFGWYNLLNFVLQGGFGVLLLRYFKLGRLFCTAGGLVFLTMPVFIERVFRHDALASQWLILAALLFYFTARRRAHFPAVGFFLLCAIAPGVHTYFLPMVYALLLAALIERALRTRRWLRAGVYLLVCFVGTLAVSYVIGMLTRGGSGEAWGFGQYSMNLNAPFNPSSFDWFAESGRMGWSRLLPMLPQNHHQYDGFNYLGLGVLAGWAGMAVYSAVGAIKALGRKQYGYFKRAGRLLAGHLPLLLVCLCLCVFAVSHVVVINQRTLFTVPLPDVLLRLGAIFRASGRMFWPVAYLLTLCPVLFLGRVLRGRWRTVGVTLLLAVQLFDISGVLAQKHRYFASGPIVVQNEYTSTGWVFMAEHYNQVLCLGNLFDYELAAGIIRYNPRVQTNLLLTNRGDFPAIHAGYADLMEQLLAGQPLEDDTMYLCSDEETFNQVLSGLHPAARGYQVGDYYAFANPLPGCPLPEVLPESAKGAAE